LALLRVWERLESGAGRLSLARVSENRLSQGGELAMVEEVGFAADSPKARGEKGAAALKERCGAGRGVLI
jgi:hypothetical protein